jgi:hypothetical protein
MNSLLTMVVSELSYDTVSYFHSKYESPENAKEKLRKFRIISEICALNEQIIEKGLNSEFQDFEDALQYFSALDSDCNILITRNAKDFKDSDIPVMTAEEFLKSLKKA